MIDQRKRGLFAQGAPMKSLVAHGDEGTRDMLRKQFIRVLGGQLCT